MSANAEIIAELRRVLNERDEAREQLDLTKRELGRWVDRETKAVRERDEARAKLYEMNLKLDQAYTDAERLRKERDEALARCETLRELADAAAYEQGLAQRRMMDAQRERDEARAELSKLRKDYDSVLEANVGLLDGAPYVDARAAFRRGAEAMRKRCAMWVKHNSHEDGLGMGSQRIESALAALPIPEEP